MRVMGLKGSNYIFYGLKYEFYEHKILIQTSMGVQSHSVQVNSVFTKHEKGERTGCYVIINITTVCILIGNVR